MLHAHIFLCAYHAWRDRTWLGHCSFRFSTKYMEISYHSKILLWGQWSLVTQSSCFCPISKPLSCFPTSSSLHHQPASGLVAALRIRMDSSNCVAIISFGSFSQIQVFIHLGVPKSNAGCPAGPWCKLIKSWMKEPRRKPFIYNISSFISPQVFSHISLDTTA